MNYQSTRNRCWTVSSTRAVLEGIAPDGGLYISRDLLQADEFLRLCVLLNLKPEIIAEDIRL